jgi:hypothetical protein
MNYIMNYYTFLMSSPELGDGIDQVFGSDIASAWANWAPVAALTLVDQIPGLSEVDVVALTREIAEEGPIIKLKEPGVWLADLALNDVLKLCDEIIQVIIVQTVPPDGLDLA